MPTTHLRSGTQTIVLEEQPSTLVAALVAELAEVLVASQLASQAEVAELRLGLEVAPGEFEDITERDASLESLGVAHSSVIAYKFGAGSRFGYEPYATE